MRKICYIVCAGEDFVPFDPKKEDIVLAADNGYRYLRQEGIRCDLLIGDMDSVGEVPPTGAVPTLRYPTHKNDTDTALAIKYGARRACRNFVILAGTGGRGDHTFANLSLLAAYARRGFSVCMRTPTEDIFCIADDYAFSAEDVGRTVSFFAFGGEAHNVTLRGFAYPLTEETLLPEVPLGVSNVIVSEEATVHVGRGTLLCYLQRTRDDGHVGK